MARSELLAEYVADVAAFAERGDGPYPDMQIDVLLVSYLGSAAGRPDTGIKWWSAEAKTPLERLCLAAMCRSRVVDGDGDPVSQAQVAALAGLALGTLRDLISAGELRADVRVPETAKVRLIEAGEARRFLAARGVPGI
jgi:hypothetical protein